MSVKRYDFDGNADGYFDDPFMKVREKGKFILHSDYAALLARHNALVEAVHKAMDRTVDCDKKQTDDQLIADVAYLKRLASDYFKTSVDCGNKAFAAEQKYDALLEAVGWERECQSFTYRNPLSIDAMKELLRTRYAALAEVDRLLGHS